MILEDNIETLRRQVELKQSSGIVREVYKVRMHEKLRQSEKQPKFSLGFQRSSTTKVRGTTHRAALVVVENCYC